MHISNKTPKLEALPTEADSNSSTNKRKLSATFSGHTVDTTEPTNPPKRFCPTHGEHSGIVTQNTYSNDLPPAPAHTSDPSNDDDDDTATAKETINLILQDDDEISIALLSPAEYTDDNRDNESNISLLQLENAYAMLHGECIRPYFKISIDTLRAAHISIQMLVDNISNSMTEKATELEKHGPAFCLRKEVESHVHRAQHPSSLEQAARFTGRIAATALSTISTIAATAESPARVVTAVCSDIQNQVNTMTLQNNPITNTLNRIVEAPRNFLEAASLVKWHFFNPD
ncbi:MAG: hypothetical protein QS748_10350 [Candidatus Endonucleobacter bathymodioli]|uniref:Uncharacterized protein n=1 Tax=Candidatus Endonucleibacter bathymodioli TaxID=539814 RepID=A0AA90SDP3_9GAMM|nr:hypothetical protein [Candidatus Endonucleobacter bathymodioli]